MTMPRNTTPLDTLLPRSLQTLVLLDGPSTTTAAITSAETG